MANWATGVEIFAHKRVQMRSRDLKALRAGAPARDLSHAFPHFCLANAISQSRLVTPI